MTLQTETMFTKVMDEDVCKSCGGSGEIISEWNENGELRQAVEKCKCVRDREEEKEAESREE